MFQVELAQELGPEKYDHLFQVHRLEHVIDFCLPSLVCTLPSDIDEWAQAAYHHVASLPG